MTEPRVRSPYFHSPEPTAFPVAGSYADPAADGYWRLTKEQDGIPLMFSLKARKPE